MTLQIGIVLCTFLFMIIFMVWGKLEPVVIISISLGILWFTGVLDTATAFGQFAGNTIITMVCMLICSAGLMKTSVLIHITKLVKRLNGGVILLYVIAMVTPFILSQFMGGVSALMTTIPLLIGLADTNKIPRTKLILPALVGSQFGIGLFPIGMSATTFLQKNEILSMMGADYQLGFWDIMCSRLPGVVAAMIFVAVIGYKLLPDVPGRCGSDIPDEMTLKKSELCNWKEAAAYLIFVSVLLGLIFNHALGFSLGQIAFAGAALYLLLGILTPREAFGSVNWSVIIMVAFTIAMCSALASSGAADLIAEVTGRFVTKDSSLIAICVAIFIFCAIVTQFMDNGSLINIMTPIMIVACCGASLNPLPVILCVDMLAYTMGGYSYKDMIKFGMPIILIQAAVTSVWIPFYFGLL